jgi:hypothetical protein
LLVTEVQWYGRSGEPSLALRRVEDLTDLTLAAFFQTSSFSRASRHVHVTTLASLVHVHVRSPFTVVHFHWTRTRHLCLPGGFLTLKCIVGDIRNLYLLWFAFSLPFTSSKRYLFPIRLPLVPGSSFQIQERRSAVAKETDIPGLGTAPLCWWCQQIDCARIHTAAS